MPQASYRPPRELTEREFNAIRDRLLDEAPDGLSEAEFHRWIGPRMEQALGEAENTAPKPEGSALGRFASGVGEMLNPIEMVKGVYSAVTSPIDTARSLVGAQFDQFRRAGEAAGRIGSARSPREAVTTAGEVLGRVGAGVLPLVGPMAAHAAERIGEGDVAGGLGNAAGLMAPLGVRPAVHAARRAVPARVPAALERGAQSRVVDVMAPKAGPQKQRFGVMAQKVAPQVAEMLTEEGAPFTREGLHRQVSAKLEQATADLDAAWDARLAARTFPTKPLIDDLMKKRQALTSEAVIGSRPIPSLEPPGPRVVKAATEAASTLAKGEREFVLRWLADDLKELPYQRGGSTPASRRAASEAAGAGDELGKRGFVINPRVAGTPTQEMLAALGLKGSRAHMAAHIEQFLSGKTKSPKLEALSEVLLEAWDGQRFDFDLVSDAAITKAGIRRKDLRSPLSLPKFDEVPEGIAARFFPEMVDAEPLLDVFPPQPTKVGRPIGKDVVPWPERGRAAVIDQAIAELRALGPVARYEPIRRIRQSYDSLAKLQYSRIAPDAFKNMKRTEGAADVTGAVRETLAKWDPQTAMANQPYHVWKSANDVLKAASEVSQTQSKIGRIIATRVMSIIFGGQMAGVPGQVAGAVLAPSIEQLLSTPTTRLQTARLMTKLAAAIRKKDLGHVTSLTHQFKRLAPTAAVATGRATSPSESQIPSTAPAR